MKHNKIINENINKDIVNINKDKEKIIFNKLDEEAKKLSIELSQRKMKNEFK